MHPMSSDLTGGACAVLVLSPISRTPVRAELVRVDDTMPRVALVAYPGDRQPVWVSRSRIVDGYYQYDQLSRIANEIDPQEVARGERA